jgi:integrase
LQQVLGSKASISLIYAFGMSRDSVDHDPRSEVQKAAGRIARRAEVDFTPHDLRRTAAISMASLGVDRLVIQKILNHVESGVTAIYDRHSYDAEKREALEQWAEELQAILQAGSPELEPREVSGSPTARGRSRKRR